MKTIITLLFSFLLPIMAFSQMGLQAKAFIKTVPVKNAEEVMLDVDGHVKVLQWEKPFVRLYVNVEVMHKNGSVLKQLAIAGRYHIEENYYQSELTLTVPDIDVPIVLGGELLEENVSYTLYIPNYVEVMSPSILTFNTDESLEEKLSY